MNIKQTKRNIFGNKVLPRTTKGKRVFVGLSGGVDSSVAAALLMKAGFDVTGVFMKVWEPEFLPCTWREERLDAMRVAAHLGIPLLTWDFEKEYKEGVADYMIREYRAGRTPNPDVMCNRVIKFGAFFQRAMKAGADFVATGHYARVVQCKNGGYEMKIGVDPEKDQSYFLWTIGQRELSKTLLPVGGYKKPQVRALAKKFGLPTAAKKDSQGLCFVGQLDMKDFLSHYIKEKSGNVIDETGKIIGKHRGAYFYTLGERRGFSVDKKGVSSAPLYVVAKDIPANTLTVAPASRPDLARGLRKVVRLTALNYGSGTVPLPTKTYSAQVRYHGDFVKCKVVARAQSGAEICFVKPMLVDSGQSVVIYDGERCLGGGVVV